MLGVPLCVASGGALALASYSTGRAEAVEAGLVALFGSLLMLLAWHDLSTWTIPNTIVYPATVLALLLSSAWPGRGAVESLEGGGAALAFASAVRSLCRGGLGGGDVKVAALAGMVVGYPGIVLAGVIVAVSGGLAASVLLVTARVTRSGALPYGPFIALGAIAVLLR